VVGASQYNSDYDMTASPRLDLCVYDGDIDFMKKLDAGLVGTTDLKARPLSLCIRFRGDFGYEADPSGLRNASPMDGLAGVLEFGLTAQAKELVLIFNPQANSRN
jgi:hypothetical protein